MKKLLVASALVAALVALRPSQSSAYWTTSPQFNQGFPWLEGKALNFLSFNHFHGPLYNYGPYYGPGYGWMFVANRWCGQYTPVYPAAWFGGYNVGPWSNFNNLPYPRTPAGGVGWAPGPYPGQYPAAGPVPLVTPTLVDSVKPGGPILANPISNAAPSTSNYYGGQTPEYFRPWKSDR